MRDVTPRLVVWLAICLLALAIPLLDAPLWARQREVQPHALSIVLIAMTLSLAFAGPWLARTWAAALALASASLPMLVVAAILSDQLIARGILCGGAMGGVIVISRLLSRFSWWPLIAPTLTLGPIAFGYFARDFGASVDVVQLSPLYWCVAIGS